MASSARKFNVVGGSDNVGASERDELFDIIFKSSFGLRDIVLSSGRPSHFYFDMKPSMLNPKGASLIAKQILTLVHSVKGDYIGGLEMGAVPITGAVLTHSYAEGKLVNGFFVRKKAKEHGAKKLIEGLAPEESLKDRSVVVFDDVTTSGESAMQAIRACSDEGAKVVLAVSIVDREEGARELFEKEGIPFKSLFSASEFLAHARSKKTSP
jgi:orotate phosphoribosyltransferase